MKESAANMDEGLLELYVLGGLPSKEALEIEAAAVTNLDLRKAIDAMHANLEKLAIYGATEPPFGARIRILTNTSLFAQSDNAGPPILHSKSKPQDFSKWMQAIADKLAEGSSDFDCMKIGKSEDTFSFLVKMRSAIPEEIHTNEIERILLVDGACDFHVGERTFHLVAGDQFTIPLHLPHSAETTSPQACTFILQRTKV